MPTKECVICNEEFEPYRPQVLYCGKECRKEGSKEYFRNRTLTKEQREAKNRQAAEYRKLQSTKDRMKKWNEENKEYLTTYFKENHSKKMQDPEYREMVRLRSIEKRAKQPKTFVDCLVCGKNFQRKRYNRNCSKRCSEEWLKIKRKQPANLVRSRIAGQVRKALKYEGQAKNNKTFTLLGYTKYELKVHLESYFTEKNGYSWDNMDEWHIDHIRPVASFNYTTTECEDFKKCWALSNLQPLWARDNMSKGDKWDGIINA